MTSPPDLNDLGKFTTKELVANGLSSGKNDLTLTASDPTSKGGLFLLLERLPPKEWRCFHVR